MSAATDAATIKQITIPATAPAERPLEGCGGGCVVTGTKALTLMAENPLLAYPAALS